MRRRSFLVLLVLFFTALQPNFLHPLNVMNVLRQVSISGLIAIGMTFVILTGGIDLTVGSLVALTGLVAAYVSKGGLRAASPWARARMRETRSSSPSSPPLRWGWPAAPCRGWPSPGSGCRPSW